MKQERVVLLKGLCRTQGNHWVLFPVTVTVMSLIGVERPQLLWWAGLSLLPFLLFLIRRYTNHVAVFGIGHGAAAAAVILSVKAFFNGSPQGNLLILCSLGYVFYSFVVRLDGEGRQDGSILPVAGVPIVAVAFLIERLQGTGKLDAYYTVSLILYLGFWAIAYFAERYQRFLKVNEGTAGVLPEREIFRSGAFLTAFYTLAGILLLLLTANIEWLAGLLAPVKAALLWLLRRLANGKVEQPAEVVVAEAPEVERLAPDFSGGIKVSPIWSIVENILSAIMIILAVGAVVLCVVMLIRFLWERFHRRLEVSEKRLDSVQDVRESCEIEKKGREGGFLSGRLSPEGRIRALYKKRIMSQKARLESGAARLELLTARECGSRLEAGEMAEIYEKARYSGKNCTGEDIRAMRRNCR